MSSPAFAIQPPDRSPHLARGKRTDTGHCVVHPHRVRLLEGYLPLRLRVTDAQLHTLLERIGADGDY